MGACASFPKSVKEEVRETPLPEQPKDVDLTAAVTTEVANADNEIKAEGEEKEDKEGGDDNKAKGHEEKAIESLTKEGETEAAKAAVDEEEAPKEKNSIAPIASAITSDDKKETMEIKDEK